MTHLPNSQARSGPANAAFVRDSLDHRRTADKHRLPFYFVTREWGHSCPRCIHRVHRSPNTTVSARSIGHHHRCTDRATLGRPANGLGDFGDAWHRRGKVLKRKRLSAVRQGVIRVRMYLND